MMWKEKENIFCSISPRFNHLLLLWLWVGQKLESYLFLKTILGIQALNGFTLHYTNIL